MTDYAALNRYHMALFLVESLEEVLRDKPELTIGELLTIYRDKATLAKMEALPDGKDQSTMDEKCARCGRELVVSETGFVTHLAEDGGLNRGCRAASFDNETGWDDSLNKSWKATRPK